MMHGLGWRPDPWQLHELRPVGAGDTFAPVARRRHAVMERGQCGGVQALVGRQAEVEADIELRAGNLRKHRARHAVRQVGVDRRMTLQHQTEQRAKAQEIRIENRSEEHTSELQSLMRISYAVFCLKKKTNHTITNTYLYK